MKVLAEPRNAIVRQYQKLFEMESAELEFTEDAVRAIAKKAHEKSTGARGLRTIIEEMMLDIMFELPETGAGRRYVVTPEVVMGHAKSLPVGEPRPSRPNKPRQVDATFKLGAARVKPRSNREKVKLRRDYEPEPVTNPAGLFSFRNFRIILVVARHPAAREAAVDRRSIPHVEEFAFLRLRLKLDRPHPKSSIVLVRRVRSTGYGDRPDAINRSMFHIRPSKKLAPGARAGRSAC